MVDVGRYDRKRIGGTEVRGPYRQDWPTGEQRLVLAAKLSSATVSAVAMLLKACETSAISSRWSSVDPRKLRRQSHPFSPMPMQPRMWTKLQSEGQSSRHATPMKRSPRVLHSSQHGPFLHQICLSMQHSDQVKGEWSVRAPRWPKDCGSRSSGSGAEDQTPN